MVACHVKKANNSSTVLFKLFFYANAAFEKRSGLTEQHVSLFETRKGTFRRCVFLSGAQVAKWESLYISITVPRST